LNKKKVSFQLYTNKKKAMSFDLPQSAEQLPANSIKQANAQWVEYQPTASAIGANFSAGEQTYPMSLQQPLWFDPGKSYLRLVINTSQPIPLAVPSGTDSAAGSPFLPFQGVAPSYFQAASLFSRASFSLNGVIVSQVNDYLPQVHAFARRILKPDANLKTFESAIDFSNPNFAARQAQVTLQCGLQTPEVNTKNVTMGIYDLGIKLPPADQNVKITLDASGKEAVILLSDAALNTDATWAKVLRWCKKGSTITVQRASALGVEWQGVVQGTAVDSATQITVRVSNVSGVNGSNAAIEIGDDDDSANIFFTVPEPPAPVSNTYEVYFRPPLSIFEAGYLIPGGSYMEMRLSPYSSSVYQGRAVETLSPKQAGVDFQVQIQQSSFFAYVCAGPRIENLSWLLPLDVCIGCSTQAMTSGANSQAQLLFDVPPSTYLIAVALQNRNLNDSATSSTKFTVGYPSRTGSLERSITRLYVTYRSLSQPAQLQTLEFKDSSVADDDKNPPNTAGVNLMVKRYAESAMACGLALSPGGVESFQDWLTAGGYYASYWPADSSAQSSRVTVNITTSEDLSGNTPGSFGANVVVFCVYRQVATITTEAGRWTSVQVQNL